MMTVDVDKEIWLTLVHILKGDYDAIHSDSNVVFRKQEVFKNKWERMNVFGMVNGCIPWRSTSLGISSTDMRHLAMYNCYW